jgi:hypothetical protein
MPLPNVGNLVAGPSPGGMAAAACNNPPVAANSLAQPDAFNGYAHWVGNKLELAAVGGTNYWYIPQAPSGTARFCVVPCAGGGAEAYVISDNYGGCEYHEAYNAAHNMLAFFHVHRGDGGIAQYQLAAGWVQRSVIRSQVISQTIGSNWSIRVGGYPALTVQAEDNGTTPYPQAQGLAALAMALLNRFW